MTIPVYDWIAHYASTRADCIAMEDLATGRKFTYSEFDQRVGRVAVGLRERYGIARGDRVAVLAHNSSDLFELQFACARLGAVFAPMNWRLTVPELHFIVGDCEPVVMFYDPSSVTRRWRFPPPAVYGICVAAVLQVVPMSG